MVHYEESQKKVSFSHSSCGTEQPEQTVCSYTVVWISTVPSGAEVLSYVTSVPSLYT